MIIDQIKAKDAKVLPQESKMSMRSDIHQGLIYKVIPFVTQLLRDEYAPEIERQGVQIDSVDFKHRFLLRQILDKCITLNG